MEATARKAVLLFNRLKSPEVVAKTVTVFPNVLVVALSGQFCYNCGGTHIYIEDFIRDFNVLTKNVALRAGKSSQTSPRSFETTFYIQEK